MVQTPDRSLVNRLNHHRQVLLARVQERQGLALALGEQPQQELAGARL